MSADTRAAIEAALDAHLRDEELLDEGDLVTDWLILAAALPAERTADVNAIYLVVDAEHMMNHQAQGLAAWYLFDKDDRDRE